MKTLKTFWRFLSIGVVLLFSSLIVIAAPSWTRVNYTSSTAFIGIVKINTYNPSFPITVEAGDYIGAFYGSECRMVAQVFSYNGGLYVSSVIQGGDITDMTGSSSAAEEIEFKVWDNSANAAVATTVYGTLMTQSAGEIFNYEIGKPNTNSALQSLAITGITLQPTFNSATTAYTVSIPNGGSLPASNTYTAKASDSRATVSINAATAFTSGIATSTIVVTAEDGTKTTYTITYTEEACATAKPTVAQTSYSICEGEAFPTITASGNTIKWYNSSDLTASGSFPVTGASYTPTAAGTYYVTNTNGCENTDYVTVTVTQKSKPIVLIGNLEASYCANAASSSLQGTPVGGTFTIDGTAATQFNPSTLGAGLHTVVYTVTQNGCSAEAIQPVTVISVVNPNVSAVPTEMCAGETISLTPTTGTWSGTGVNNVAKTFTSTVVSSHILAYSETDVNGCTSNATITVAVKAIPVVDLSSVKTTACAGEVVSLTPITGTWSGTGVTGTNFTSTNVGSYILTYTETVNGCKNTKATSILVTKPSTPIVSNVAICEGSNFDAMTSDVAASWYLDKAATPVATGAKTYAPTGITATTTYYVNQVVSGCSSDYAEATYTIKSKPSTPVVDATHACMGSTADYIVRMSGTLATGATLQWYDESGVAKGTTSIQQVTVTAAQDYAYTVTQSVNGCTSDAAIATLTVYSLPVLTITVDPSYCSNDATSVTLSANIAGGDFTIDGIINDTFVPSSMTEGQHTVGYTYQDEYGCFGETETTFSVNNCSDPAVETITLSETSLSLIKGDVSSPLTVTILPAEAPQTVLWSSSNTNVATVDVNGVVTAVGIGSAVITAKSTYTTTKTADCAVTVSACPTAVPVLSASQTICEGETPAAFTATGTNVVWYSAITAGTVLAEAPSYTSTETAVGTYTYYASQNPSCESTRASVTLTIKAKPTAPIVSNVAICEGSNFDAMSSDVAASWYLDKAATPVAIGAKTYAPTGITATTTYYVNQVVSGCSSDFAEATYTIKSKPSTPVVDATHACMGSTADYIVRMSGTLATGATLQWYDESGAAKGTTSIQQVTVTAAQDYAYTVTQSVNGCTSDAATATLTVYSLPVLTITVDPSYCSNDATSVTLSANIAGGDFTIDGIINDTFVPSSMTEGQHTAGYTYQDEHGCSGETETTFSVNNCSDPAVETITLSETSLSLIKGDVSSPLTVTILPAEAPQTVSWSSSNTNVATVDANGVVTAVSAGSAVITATSTYTTTKTTTCAVTVVAPVESVSFNNTTDITVGESSTVDVSNYLVINPTDASIDNIEWTSSDETIATVANGVVTTSTVSTDTPITITAMVTTVDGTSKSAEIAITIINGCDLAAPVVLNASQSVCAGSGDAVSFSATGSASADWNWVDATDKIVATTNTFSTATIGTYYVYQVSGSCVSSRTTVSLTEKTKPTAPVVADVAVCEGVNGTFSSNVTAVWYYSSTNAELATAKTYSPTTAGTYYAKQLSDGCYSDATTVSYTINALPQFTTTDVSVIYGAVVPNLEVTTDIANTVTWYFNSAEVGTGSSFATGKTASGTYTYNVTVSNPTTGCTAAQASVILQISDCDLVAPTVTSDNESICEEGTNPTFTATAPNSIIWYSDVNLSSQVATGATFTPTNTAVGTYNYYVVQKGTCQSPAKKVTLTINPLPTISIAVTPSLKTTDAPAVVSLSPIGGVLSGQGVSNSKFDPSIGAGEYVITYTYQDVNGCSSSASATVVVTVPSDRTQLGDTIARANAIFTQYANSERYTDIAKQTLGQAISVAQNYYDNYISYTNQELYAQVLILSDAIKAFLTSQPPQIDLTPLQQKINEAIDAITSNEIRKGDAVGNIPELSFTILQDAIAAANGVVSNPPTYQSGVTTAVTILNNAILAFFASEVPNTVTGVSFSASTINMIAGQTLTPDLVLTPAGVTSDYTNFTWVSSNENVAKVNASGEIEAIQNGSVSITATYTSNPSISARVVVIVTNKPELVSVELNRLGNQLYLNFSEAMSKPMPEIYSDLYVYGTTIPIYNILDVALWPVEEENRIVVTLGSYIDDLSEIRIVYNGTSLSSAYGAVVEPFNYDKTAVEDLEELQIVAYPTLASTTVTVSGLTPGQQISVVSTTGQQVANQIVSFDTEDIDVSQFVSGTYYVLVSDDGIIKARKAFVKK